MATSCITPFIWNSQIGKSTRIESKLVVAKGWGWREWKVSANGYEVSFWCDKNVLKLTVEMVAQPGDIL